MNTLGLTNPVRAYGGQILMNTLLNLPMQQKEMPESSADVGEKWRFRKKKIPAVVLMR
jgi:hypothetical protein